jgi:hypothetical protein
MKTTIKGFVTYRAPLWAGAEPKIEFYTYDPAQYGNKDKVIVREHSFEVEVPDDFDPRPQMVANIDAEITKARAEFTARVTELQEQKQRLLAIENTVDAK